MIEEIVEMILKEARGRPENDPVRRIHAVFMQVDRKIADIMDNLKEEERRLRDEDERRDHWPSF